MSDNEASDSLPENERLLTYRAASGMGGMDMFQLPLTQLSTMG